MKKVAKSSKYLLSYYLQNNFSPCYKLKRLKYLLHLIKNILNLLNKFKTNFINLIYRYLRILYCVYIDTNFYLLFKKKKDMNMYFMWKPVKLKVWSQNCIGLGPGRPCMNHRVITCKNQCSLAQKRKTQRNKSIDQLKPNLTFIKNLKV